MAEVTPGAVAPEVPVAPAADAAPEIQSTADGFEESPEDKPEAPPERTFTQKEVNEIAAKRAAQAERHALKLARAEARAEMAERQLQQRQAPQGQPEKSGEPQVKDYQDYESYLVAKAVHQLEQKQQRERQTNEHQSAQQRQHQAEAAVGKALLDRLKAVEGEYPDIIELVRDDAVPFEAPTAHFIADSEVGGKLAYHLATNPKEAARIAGLSPAGQFRELTKLESTISAPPKPTTTPAPIVPNKGGSSGIRSLSDLIGGSQEDFEKRRNDRIKAQRARR